jgi:hypothetical protein
MEIVLKLYIFNNCTILVRGKGFFSSPQRPDWLLGPPSLISNGYGFLYAGVKWLGREADHSRQLLMPRLILPGSSTPIPPHVLMAWCLIKQRDNFTFAFNEIFYSVILIVCEDIRSFYFLGLVFIPLSLDP